MLLTLQPSLRPIIGEDDEIIKIDGLAVWVLCPECATADTLSTAFMIVNAEQIDKICSTFSSRKASIYYLKTNSKDISKIRYFGDWKINFLGS